MQDAPSNSNSIAPKCNQKAISTKNCTALAHWSMYIPCGLYADWLIKMILLGKSRNVMKHYFKFGKLNIV